MLSELMKLKKSIAIAGTHGKTTTTSLLTHLLRVSGKKITAFLGGIAENIVSNFLLEGLLFENLYLPFRNHLLV